MENFFHYSQVMAEIIAVSKEKPYRLFLLGQLSAWMDGRNWRTGA
jgi:hypothetical protein